MLRLNCSFTKTLLKIKAKNQAENDYVFIFGCVTLFLVCTCAEIHPAFPSNKFSGDWKHIFQIERILERCFELFGKWLFNLSRYKKNSVKRWS